MSSDISPESIQQRWITIDTTALAGNVRVLKEFIGAGGPKLMAVVKANAYGHGAAAIAPVLREAGADWFGVTTLDEAIELIEAGIDSTKTPILLFAPLTTAEQVRAAIDNDLHLTVCDDSHLDLIEAAGTGPRKPNLHLKVDTGMGRLGCAPAEALTVAGRWRGWAGVYTHMARAADDGLTSARRQLTKFLDFLRLCERNGFQMGIRHCANSAAAIRMPDARLDMVRIGTALYGQMPSEFVTRLPGLSPDTFQAHAQVVFVRSLESGDSVGYGSEFVASKTMRTAVLPIGFADGFGVAPSSLYSGMRGVKKLIAERDPARQPHVILNGQRAQVLGRIAMQMIVVDVTGFDPPIKIGDTADIPMRRLSAGALLPRRYMPDGVRPAKP
jgi:alanine racemase